MALRRRTDQAEAIRSRCLGHRFCHRHVPFVANEAEIGCVVFEYGSAWTYRVVLRYGDIQIDPIWYYNVCSASRIMVVSELVRGCGIL